MDAYIFFSIWIFAGTSTFVLHNVYVWDVASPRFKTEITSLSFFILVVAFFPSVLFVILKIACEVTIELKRQKNKVPQNG